MEYLVAGDLKEVTSYKSDKTGQVYFNAVFETQHYDAAGNPTKKERFTVGLDEGALSEVCALAGGFAVLSIVPYVRNGRFSPFGARAYGVQSPQPVSV